MIRTAIIRLGLAAFVASTAYAKTPDLSNIVLPDGFSIEVYAEDVRNARAMSLGDNGVLYVGSRQEGAVYAVVDEDGDHKADKVHVLAEDLDMPSGLEYIDGDLYIAAISTIFKLPNIGANLESPPELVVVTDKLPTDKHHGWKYLRQGPDGKLYTNIGAPCNTCDEGDPYATLVRMDLDGSNLEIVARGVRNSVGFTWHPESNELYFTDNGRDMLGDNTPACELNRVTEVGQHFGYPYVHAGDVIDPEFGKGRKSSDYVPPTQKLGPHVAPLGLAFYTGSMFPAEYKNQILIAEHGSWNRSKKIGYRLTLVNLDANGNATNYEPFVDGWLQGDKPSGRPVDVLNMPDGSILVSDDLAGAIYRITYTK